MTLRNQMTKQYLIYRMNKAIKKQEKETTAPNKLTISIKGMCQKEEEKGKPNYFNQIRNRIYRECERDESLLEYIRLTPKDLEDILLDSDGLVIFSDILMGYFNEEDIINLHRYMRNRDKLEQNEFEMMGIIKALSSDDITKMLSELDVTEEKQKNLLVMLKEELQRRKVKLSFR